MNQEEINIDFKNNPNPMWVYSTESLKILKVNKSALELYGYNSEEFLNLTIEDLRPAHEIARLKKELLKKKRFIQQCRNLAS